MRELAGGAVSPSAITPDRASAKPTPQRRRRIPVLLVVLTVIVLLSSAGAAWQGWFPWQRGKPTTASNTVSVNLASYDLHCPSAAVWSPDNTQIAVLAQLGACTNSDAGIVAPNVIALFSSQGKLVRLLYPDTLTLGKNTPTTAQPTVTSNPSSTDTASPPVEYFALAWSPDSKRLALPYQTLLDSSQSPTGITETFEDGVALLPTDGGDGEKLSGSLAGYGGIWDTQTRTVVANDEGNPPPQLSFAYKWTQQGTLISIADASTSGPVGNSTGGEQFTIWQPGSVYLDSETNALYFEAVVTAWSPDGRYLAPFLGYSGLLTPHASGIVRASDGEFEFAPRDNGLLTAASQLKSPTDPYAQSMPVAWRGDGRLIAALQPNLLIDQINQDQDGATVPSTTEHVAIYDCATGTKQLTLATKPLANTLQITDTPPEPLLRWSSTGQQLFLLDTAFDSLTIWDIAL